MNSPYSGVIREAALTLYDAKEKIKAILSAVPELQTLAYNTCNRIAHIEQSLYGIGGLPAIGSVNVAENLFKPLTEIMGIPVDVRKPISEADVKPTATERERFIEKVESLYSAFSNLSDDKVLQSIKLPNGESILRGVAKLAGLEHWRDASIDIELIAAIRKGMADRSEVERAVNLSRSAAELPKAFEKVELPWTKELPEQQHATQPSTIASQQGEKTSETGNLQLNSLQDTVRMPEQLSDQQRLASIGNESDGDGIGETAASASVDAKANSNQDDKEQDEKALLVARAKEMKSQGKTIRQIADDLNISTGTASNYVNAK